MADPGSVLLAHGPSTGGIRRHVDALAHGLLARGWDVTTAPLPAGPAAWRRLRHLSGHVDVVHAHGLRTGWWAALVPRRPPLVVTIHNVVLDDVAGWKAPALRRLERMLPRHVDAVVATSPDVAAAVAPRAAIVAPVGPPPIPLRAAGDVRRARGVASGAPLVVAMGRLHPQKGFDTLLDAVPLLRARIPGVRVVIVGEGPLERHLQGRLRAEGLHDVVQMVGSTADAAGELAAADVVAVPSIWESGPLVVTEAMELGAAVVATPVGFVPELVVDGETGRVVPVGDAAALAAALGDVLAAPGHRAALGVAARARVCAWLDREAAVDAVVAVYEGVRR